MQVRIPRIWRSRRGVALLMTLGFLSLLVVMALSFATSAIRYQQAAELSEAMVTARLQAETTLQKLYAQLSLDFSNPDEPRNIFPASKPTEDLVGLDTISNAWDGRYYWVSIPDSDQEDQGDNIGLREAYYVPQGAADLTPTSNNSLPSIDAAWIHEIAPETRDRIIARLAYLVIDESGKIDPSALIGSMAEGSETRTGYSPAEIDLRVILGSALGSSFQYTDVGSPDGKLAPGTRWFSHYYIFNNNPAAVANAATVLERVTPYSYDIEAFHVGNDDKHRFDLRTTDWNSFNNSISASGLGSASGDFYSDDETITTPSGGIAWFAEAEDDMPKNQIMANIIDYCDSDSTATTNYPSIPTYCGNEKVPYINEFNFVARIDDDGDGTYTLNLICFPELVNIYSDAVGAGGALQVDVTITGTNVPSSPRDETFSWTGLGAVAANTYGQPAYDTVTIDLGASNSISNVTLQVKLARLTDGATVANLWDLALTDASATGSVTSGSTKSINVEVDDPRHNTDANEWTWQAWVPVSGGTIGYKNDSCQAPAAGAPDSDDEAPNYMGTGVVGDTVNLSTAYIRNAGMQSLWELGCIHRGAPWQTINLATYNPANTNALGMGEYIEGDANLLDQVKLDDDTEVTGRVNPNTYLSSVLEGLLSGLTVGGTYDAPGNGTALSAANISAIIGSGTIAANTLLPGTWLYENGSDHESDLDDDNDNEPFASRSEIARVTTLSDGSIATQTTDRSQEELIGKLANILTVRQNIFTVISIAQVVHDTPSGVMGGQRLYYDDGVDSVRAEQKILSVLYRDALNNKFKILRHEYLLD